MNFAGGNIYRWAIAVLLVVSSMWAIAQSTEPTAADQSQPTLLDVSIEILRYTESLDSMISQVEQADSTKIVELRNELWKVDLKWKLYYQKVESMVATDDDLMSSVLLYNTRNQTLTDSLDSRSKLLDSQKSFDKEFANLQRSAGEYEQMQKDALTYSLSDKLADKLSALKANEEMLFGQVQSSYATIGTVCSEFGDPPQKVEADSLYAKILVCSERIKTTEYQSLFDRAKDYLYGLAAVVMVLMFINMVQTKIAAAKKLRESAKVMDKMMKGGDKQYPTI
ncbi:MAG: hypothetical protein SNG35_00960 [Rikenellaceae bacterium]